MTTVKWEYQAAYITNDKGEDVGEFLNGFGADGWEVFQVDNLEMPYVVGVSKATWHKRFYMKRPTKEGKRAE